MGSSPSKHVAGNLRASPEFTTACDSVYEDTLSLTQHAFPGLPRYQIASASDRLYQTLTPLHIPLIHTWLTAPPTRTQIDSALRRALPSHDDDADAAAAEGAIETLGASEFREFAVDLYGDAIVSNAQKAVMVKVPIGAVGIAGVGAVMRSGVGVVGAVIGVYAVGVATSVYLSLGFGG